MPERFTAELDGHLVDLLVEEIGRVLPAAGFANVLRLPGPDVWEFRHADEVVSVQREDTGHHRCRLTVESESADVYPFIAEAARLVVLGVVGRLVAAMPWVDRAALEREVDALLREGLNPST